MRGSIVKRGVGYSYVLYLGRSEDGRKRQKWVGGFRTKREAESALTETLGRVQTGQWADPGRVTVAEYLAEWLEAVTPGVRPSTAASYRQVVRCYLLPHLGRHRLAAVTPGQLNKLYATLAVGGNRNGQPLSARSVRYAHTIIGKALADAVDWGLLARNPARSAKPPKQTKTSMAVWTPAEAKRFLIAVRDDPLYALWWVLIVTGLRRGEGVGLRWSDVDLERGVISVQHALISVDYGVISAEPKTARGRRSVALDPITVEVLRQHRQRQLADQDTAGPLWTATGYVFTREHGQPYHPQRLPILFKRLVLATGLPEIRLHDLRHTSATLALSSGIHPKIVQERLGHSSIGITLDTYSHVIGGLQHEAAVQVAALVSGD
jgi:integrase